jgi:hypothetical protein
MTDNGRISAPRKYTAKIAVRIQRMGRTHRNHFLSDTISWQQRDFECRPRLRRHTANRSTLETRPQRAVDGHSHVVAVIFWERCRRIPRGFKTVLGSRVGRVAVTP